MPRSGHRRTTVFRVNTHLAVNVTKASRRYGPVLAVNDVSLHIQPGQLVALLGPNGAGKSSLVGLLEGFAKPDSGSVEVLGRDPWAEPDAVRCRIGVMLQTGGAHASSRVGEMLALVAACSGNPHRCDQLLEVLGLAHVTRTPVRHLSGGQAQRLALAMALVGRPELLILDEPTAGLDVQARHLVWDLLRAAKRDGVAVLLTTHLLDEAEQLADQIAIMSAGTLVATGSPAALTGAAQQLTFISPDGLNIAMLSADIPELSVTVTGDQYTLRGPVTADTVAAVTAALARQQILARDLRIGSSLEQIYLELVQP